MPDQITLRKETNLYDDEAIKAVRDSVTSVDNKVTSQYATCSTPSSTAAKVASVDGTFTLFKNARVSVYFSYANTTSSPTLNVAATGAKPIWAYGGPLSNTGNTFNWAAGATVEFVYDGSHWLVVDSSATKLVSGLDEKLNQEVIFNRLTNDGAIRGLFMQNNQMYINMDYLQTGTIKLGGPNNGNGLLMAYDTNGNVIAKLDKDGLMATGDLMMYNKLNASGTLKMESALANDVEYMVYVSISGKVEKRTGDGFFAKRAYNSKMTGQYAILLSGNSSGTTGSVTEEIYALTGWAKTVYIGDENSNGQALEFDYLTDGFSLNAHTSGTPSSERATPYVRLGNCYVNIGNDRITSPSTNYDYYIVLSTSGLSNGPYINVEQTQSTSSVLIRASSSVQLSYSSSYWRLAGASQNGTIAIQGSSSKRYKHDITENISEELDAHRLYELRMKQFIFNSNHELQYPDMANQVLPGFIAEDVAEIYPSAVIHNEKGEIENWDERRIIPAMLTLIQEQNEKIKKLEEKLCM